MAKLGELQNVTDLAAVMAALIDAANHLLQYRNIESYIASQSEKPNYPGFVSARRNAMPGNIATCSLLTSAGLHSNSLLAPSHDISSEVREYQRSTARGGHPIQSSIASLIHGNQPGASKACWVTGPALNSPAVLYPMNIRPLKGKRQADSECVILNVIDGMIAHNQVTKLETLVLSSERVPCRSCAHVIITFLSWHPHLNLVLQFRHNTGHVLNGRGFAQLGSELTAAGLHGRVAAVLAGTIFGSSLRGFDLYA